MGLGRRRRAAHRYRHRGFSSRPRRSRRYWARPLRQWQSRRLAGRDWFRLCSCGGGGPHVVGRGTNGGPRWRRRVGGIERGRPGQLDCRAHGWQPVRPRAPRWTCVRCSPLRRWRRLLSLAVGAVAVAVQVVARPRARGTSGLAPERWERCQVSPPFPLAGWRGAHSVSANRTALRRGALRWWPRPTRTTSRRGTRCCKQVDLKTTKHVSPVHSRSPGA